jgi:pimeloyl-ACP methyl ester carboxylesterase
VTTEASYPRSPGSIILEKPSNNDEDYRLKICYRRYQAAKIVDNPINLVFLHGVGMNKGLWHYYIDLLYQNYPRLNVCIAVDSVNHGDSAQINIGKLGHFYNWQDGSRDLCKIVKNEAAFLKQNAINIVIGHSMGGAMSLIASLLEPNLFNAVVLVNPVSWTNEMFRMALVMGMNKWLTTSQMKTDFSIKTDDWLQEITDYFKTESLFKHFDKTILNNMLNDEYNGIYDPKKNYNEVKLKSTKYHQLCSYASSFESLMTAMPLYENVKTPVYFLHSEYDLQQEDACEFMEHSLEKVITTIGIPNSYHSVNGDSPHIFRPVLEATIEQIIEHHANRSIKDFDFEKHYGPNYKKNLLEKFLGDFMGSDLRGKL